jgi:hypothetical protein
VLRLADLQNGMRGTKVMNVGVPDSVFSGIERLAKELRCTRTEAVLALLGEGLDEFENRKTALLPKVAPAPRGAARARRA